MGKVSRRRQGKDSAPRADPVLPTAASPARDAPASAGSSAARDVLVKVREAGVERARWAHPLLLLLLLLPPPILAPPLL